MGEGVGPRQTLVMQFFFLAASKAVGLRIDVHSCLGLRVTCEVGAIRAPLSLPLVILETAGG
eukprot:13058004-Alexandrium_andersonii.AAC.1